MALIDRRDGVSGDLGIKKRCRLVATTNVTRSGLQTIDGVTWAANDMSRTAEGDRRNQPKKIAPLRGLSCLKESA